MPVRSDAEIETAIAGLVRDQAGLILMDDSFMSTSRCARFPRARFRIAASAERQAPYSAAGREFALAEVPAVTAVASAEAPDPKKSAAAPAVTKPAPPVGG